jgi:Ser/Thr protein kinase RdoA (MazF antagonist)
MELAVCLSKYADQPSEALEIFRQFIEGFCEEGRLQRREVEILPELIILRILSNVVYFMGRAIAGEDGYESLTSRAGNYYSRIAWITQNRQKIIDLIPESMIE